MAPKRERSCIHENAHEISEIVGQSHSRAETEDEGTSPRDMVLIPAGDFEMGDESADSCDNRQPVHRVYLDAFYMDQCPVTVGHYREFLIATEHNPPDWGRLAGMFPTNESSPMIYVSWHDAIAYAEWVGKRLPTEAEWEKAARGGLMGKTYPWGDTIDYTKANYNGHVNRRHGGTTPVGSYPPNGYGLYDMVGNVWEWCLDEYDEAFYGSCSARSPLAGDKGISELLEAPEYVSTMRALRGGSWSLALYNNLLELAARFYFYPSYLNAYIGFRCVKSLIEFGSDNRGN